MGRHSAALSFLMFGAALQLSGCTEIPASDANVPASPDGAPASAMLDGAARNARMIGATSHRLDGSAAVVTYVGPPRDFVTCSGGPDPAARRLALDARTTLRAEGAKLAADTAYVVTASDSGGARRSVAFGRSDSGSFADGTRCQSTGRLEGTLLGLK